MSNANYERLADLNINYLQIHSPVEPVKGALLWSKDISRVLLQLKLMNRSDEEIASVTIGIEVFDEHNQKISSAQIVYHTYRDLNIKPREMFGEKNPAVLDSRVRNVYIKVLEVVFTSGRVWKSMSEALYLAPGQEALSDYPEDFQSFLKDKYKAHGLTLENLKFLPKATEEAWICSCGRPNHHDEAQCLKCAISRDFILEITDGEKLNHEFQIYSEEVKRKKEEEEKRLQIAKARNQKIGKVVIMGCAVIATLGLGSYYFMSNSTMGKYIYANTLYHLDKYTEAEEIYSGLEGYKDSAENAQQSKYKNAEVKKQSGELEEALKLFTQIQDYGDASTHIGEINLNLGLSHYDQSDYERSADYFDELVIKPEDSKIKDKIADTYYQLAVKKADLKAYEEAVVLAKKAKEYDSSKSLTSKLTDLDKTIRAGRVEEDYELTIQKYYEGDYTYVFNEFAGVVGYYQYYHYDWDSLKDYKDAKKYFIASAIKSLTLEYENDDIMEYDHGTAQYALKTLYESGQRISGFDDVDTYLNNKVFTSIWLEGRFANAGTYFEYIIKEDGQNSDYNLPWYAGKYMKLSDYGRTFSIGDEGSWKKQFQFDFSYDKNILYVYSYKDGRNYTLYRQY